MLRTKLIKLLCGLKKRKLFSHSSVCKGKNLANKQEELELLPDEHRFDLLGFIKESGGKSHLTGMAKFTVLSYLRAELQKRRGSSSTNPAQMVLSTLLQEKVQSGCSLLSATGSQIAVGSRTTASSHLSKIPTGQNFVWSQDFSPGNIKWLSAGGSRASVTESPTRPFVKKWHQRSVGRGWKYQLL